MRSSHGLDRLGTSFDDERLVAHAGLLLPATLAAQLGLRELVDELLDLGSAPGLFLKNPLMTINNGQL
jgi:hypothetical protein